MVVLGATQFAAVLVPGASTSNTLSWSPSCLAASAAHASCHPAKENEQHLYRWMRARGGKSCLTSWNSEFKMFPYISRACDGWRRMTQHIWPYHPQPSPLGMAVPLCSSKSSRHLSCLQPACLPAPLLFLMDTGFSEPSQHQQPHV